MISSNDWFDVLNSKKTLSSTERMWLRTGVEATYQEEYHGFFQLKEKLETHLCNKYNITVNDLLSNNKTRDVVEARQLIMYCLRRNSVASFSKISSLYNRHYSTAIYACKVCESLIESDLSFALSYKDIALSCGLNNEARKIHDKYIDITNDSGLPKGRRKRRVIYNIKLKKSYSSVKLAAEKGGVTAETVRKSLLGWKKFPKWEYRYEEIEI